MSILTVLIMIAAGVGTIGGLFYLVGSQFRFFRLGTSLENAGWLADVALGFVTLYVIVIGLFILIMILYVICTWIKKLYNGPFNP